MFILLCALLPTVQSVRVMTWNLWNERFSATSWEGRVGAVLREVRKQRPAVLAVQECTAGMLEMMDLDDSLPYETPFSPSDPARTGEGLVIFSSVPIETSWLERLPDGRNDRNQRMVLWADIDGVLYGNVHLSYDSADATHQLLALLDRAPPTASVLMGDFNVYASDQDQFHRMVESRGWSSIWDGPTWSAVSGLRNPADHILVRSNTVNVIASQTSSRRGTLYAAASDHLAVIGDVELK